MRNVAGKRQCQFYCVNFLSCRPKTSIRKYLQPFRIGFLKFAMCFPGEPPAAIAADHAGEPFQQILIEDLLLALCPVTKSLVVLNVVFLAGSPGD